MQEASFTVPVLLVIEKSLAILLHPISSYPSLKNRFNDILPLPGYREKKKMMTLAAVRNTYGSIYVENM